MKREYLQGSVIDHESARAISKTLIPIIITTLFLGSVNGRVWKTTHFHATPALHYTPTTDMNLPQFVGTLVDLSTDPNLIAYGQ
ncbi:unnamed protein product [Didymodactylos carnosus]|uniref:Uncharacterized protein n=1 Tax=Didymodactylos carnosus TaxID=1234261 RepID=A0A815QQP5_9BILA|nr:unnamed protein product [Didymodactylos carnosus]CAF1467124.1 unnamed protein product [Didymodactylos carnosus]CAF4176358.1 unnamed protein product [Didymodactylos carnosus]CAF4335969.1 unnamed protein product [Didymodactylos carnosus]